MNATISFRCTSNSLTLRRIEVENSIETHVEVQGEMNYARIHEVNHGQYTTHVNDF